MIVPFMDDFPSFKFPFQTWLKFPNSSYDFPAGFPEKNLQFTRSGMQPRASSPLGLSGDRDWQKWHQVARIFEGFFGRIFEGPLRFWGIYTIYPLVI
jgi:hypothetical protein